MRLPDVLERLGLITARMTLLFALGQEQALREEGYVPAGESADAVQRFFELLQDQPAAKDIPAQPLLILGSTSVLRSVILGVEILVETANTAAAFGIAESLLGVLEAFLATSDETDVLPHAERVMIGVRPADDASDLQLTFPDGAAGCAVITHPTGFALRTAAEARSFTEWLRKSLAEIVSRVLIIRDVHAWLNRLSGQEKALSRALTLGDALTLNTNVFGGTYRLRLVDWTTPSDREYAALRTSPWRAVAPADTEQTAKPLSFGQGLPPADLTDRSQMKHTDRRVLSPIDMALWNRANWRATLFAVAPGVPPLLALAFEDGQAGQAIFRAWQQRIGREDKDNVLRLVIVRGVSERNPAEYAVLVGPNLRHVESAERKTIVLVSRANRMVPSSSQNLDMFLTAYKRAGAFLLAPAQMGADGPAPFVSLAIAKHDLHIRQAWEIGENDPDMCALHADDVPIIPSGEMNPPVRGALVRLRAFAQASGESDWGGVPRPENREASSGESPEAHEK